MVIGIRAHDFGRLTKDELLKKVITSGFDGVQLVIPKAFSDVKIEDFDIIEEVRDFNILMLGAYFNPVHPDANKVISGIANFQANIALASRLGVKYVGTETGSRSGDQWIYHPSNRLKSTKDLAIENLRKLNVTNTGVKIALEGAYGHVAYNPQTLLEIGSSLASDVVYIVDIFNYLYIGNYARYLQILQKAVKILGEKIVIFHLKNFKVENGQLVQCGLDEGYMNYSKIMQIIKEFNPESTLIFEGITGDNIQKSYDFIKKIRSAIQ
ncbi:MAG: sugar phosphate isomerase/epimerase [Acholeplasmatales bacterium]|jgi:sugar phosphate isomerase/epimerase|nr:sugar phosphate isomerase/epimerase [Acholeplasmatales bacterium]